MPYCDAFDPDNIRFIGEGEVQCLIKFPAPSFDLPGIAKAELSGGFDEAIRWGYHISVLNSKNSSEDNDDNLEELSVGEEAYQEDQSFSFHVDTSNLVDMENQSYKNTAAEPEILDISLLKNSTKRRRLEGE